MTTRVLELVSTYSMMEEDYDLFGVLEDLIKEVENEDLDRGNIDENSKDDIDSFLLEASQCFETVQQEQTPLLYEPAKKRFAQPVTEAELLKKIEGAVPRSTRKTTTWAVKTWQDWADNRKSISAEAPPPTDLATITNDELDRWLSCFVTETRNQDGDYYHGGTLYSLCAGIQRSVRESRTAASKKEPLDIYKDPTFEFFRRSFDSVLKELHSLGIGMKKKQAEVISFDTEEQMWMQGCLGSDNPQQLLDTLVYCFGLNLALRSGKEHRDLRPDMLEAKEPAGSLSYILYTECGSKNHTGGLRERKVTNKSVKIFADEENPKRCVVRLFKKYLALRPDDAPVDAFYLTPLKAPLPSCWYISKPVGHNTLSKTVKKLCSKIGAEGNYTNHSLRRTCATRLYQSGKVDDQQIMGITGHRSLDAVRVYKKVSGDQEEQASKIVQMKKATVEKKNILMVETKENQELVANAITIPADIPKPASNMFNFSNCHVTINQK